MSRLSLSFFTVAALCGLAGMVFGAVMGMTQDFSLSPSHAHLNLLGWTSLALMGGYYALSGRGGRLGWGNFVLSSTGALAMSISLGIYLAGDHAFFAGVLAGTVLTVAGMVTFVSSVLAGWAGDRTLAV